MLGIVQAASEISGVEESAIWVYLSASRQTIWWNTVTCCHGLAQEQQWFQTLPPELKRYLSSIGVENKKLADKGEING